MVLDPCKISSCSAVYLGWDRCLFQLVHGNTAAEHTHEAKQSTYKRNLHLFGVITLVALQNPAVDLQRAKRPFTIGLVDRAPYLDLAEKTLVFLRPIVPVVAR